MDKIKLKDVYRTDGKFSAEYGGSVIVLSLKDLLSVIEKED